MSNEFGFTNDDAEFQRVLAFRSAAVADGWDERATYDDLEPKERASKHNKDGFTMMVFARNRPGGKWKYEASVSLWGPDGMTLKVPDSYNWEAIKADVRHCHYCDATDVDTKRVAFANRACLKCQPVEQAKLPRNWAD